MQAEAKPLIEAVKAEIDKMSRVQKTMTAAAILLTMAYRNKERIAHEQFVDVLKVSLETLANTADYEGQVKVLDVITEAAPARSLPPELGAVMLALLDRLDDQSNKLKTAHDRLKLMMDMLREAEARQ